MKEEKDAPMTENPETAARSRKYLGWAVLFIGFGFGLTWRRIIHSRVLFGWWEQMYGKVSDPFFFRLEEFFDQPDSTLSVDISWLLLFAGLLVMLILSRGTRRWYENLLLFLVFAFQFFCLQPCLCASKDRGRQVYCANEFRQIYFQLQESGGELPDSLTMEWHKPKYAHEVIYHGKGRSLNEKGERFVILEDAPRSHVGDRRHRLWSDGKLESWYPWKEEKK